MYIYVSDVCNVTEIPWPVSSLLRLHKTSQVASAMCQTAYMTDLHGRHKCLSFLLLLGLHPLADSLFI